MSQKFLCAACGETFESDKPDEEALAESKLLWGDLPPNDLVVICDDCFQRGVVSAHAEHMSGTKPN